MCRVTCLREMDLKAFSRIHPFFFFK
ncbi:unnamed protein product, partial [Vitis vinifera]